MMFNCYLFVVADVLQTMDLTKELDKLQNNRALGPPKHKKQVYYYLPCSIITTAINLKLSYSACI